MLTRRAMLWETLNKFQFQHFLYFQPYNLLPLDFRRQMNDLVLLFKYKTGTVTSNFGRFIRTATRHYRTRNFHQANFDLLFRHNQEYYCNSYFPRTVKLWNSLPNILKSSQDLLWFRVHLYEHFRGLLKLTVRHDLSIIFHTFFFFFLFFFFFFSFLIYCVII